MRNSKNNSWHKNRNTHLAIGFIIAIGIMLVLFEWKTTRKILSSGEGDIVDFEFLKVHSHQEMARTTFIPKIIKKINDFDDAEKKFVRKVESITKLEKSTSGFNFPITGAFTGGSMNKISINRSPGIIVKKKESNNVHDIVGKMPLFGECANSDDLNLSPRQCSDKALLKYLSDNIVYPRIAKEIGIEGKVVVEFIIDVDGSVKQIKILRGLEGGCSEEVIRVISKMPKWQAGMQNNTHVKVRMRIPVVFSLDR